MSAGRPEKELIYLGMAMMLGTRAQCAKRQVGCILVNETGIIVGSGYNGRIAGLPNCTGEDKCVEFCEGMHAEINALIHCTGKPFTAYVSCQPCSHCTKALIAAGAKQLAIGTGELDEEQRHGQALWQQHGLDLLEVDLERALFAAQPNAQSGTA